MFRLKVLQVTILVIDHFRGEQELHWQACLKKLKMIFKTNTFIGAADHFLENDYSLASTIHTEISARISTVFKRLVNHSRQPKTCAIWIEQRSKIL